MDYDDYNLQIALELSKDQFLVDEDIYLQEAKRISMLEFIKQQEEEHLAINAAINAAIKESLLIKVPKGKEREDDDPCFQQAIAKSLADTNFLGKLTMMMLTPNSPGASGSGSTCSPTLSPPIPRATNRPIIYRNPEDWKFEMARRQAAKELAEYRASKKKL